MLPWAAEVVRPRPHVELGRDREGANLFIRQLEVKVQCRGATREVPVQPTPDPQAAIVWSQGVKSSVKTDTNLKSFVGMGSGESVQVAFSGEGWVFVQPIEGRVAERVSGSSQSGGGIAGMLGNLTQ